LIRFFSFPAGFVDGIILATAISAIAESKNPTRLCGKVMVTAGLLLAIIATVFPFVVPLFGNRPGFFAGFVFLCGLPIVSLLPPPETKAPETNEVKIDAESKGPFLNRIFIICVLLGFAIDATSRQMLWGLVERRGLVVGFDVQQVGLILGGTAILGLLGAVFASTIGLRFGRSIPIVVGLVVTTSGMMLILYLSTKTSFIASRCAWTFGEYFYAPIYVGIIAAMDPKGRLNSLSVALGALGESVGPSLSGFIIEFTGYARDVSILACILQLSIIALVLPVALKFDRRDKKLAAATS